MLKPDIPDVGSRLKKLREEKKWTQKEAAWRTRMTENHYQRIERGNRDIRISTVKKLAHGFSIEIWELLLSEPELYLVRSALECSAVSRGRKSKRV